MGQPVLYLITKQLIIKHQPHIYICRSVSPSLCRCVSLSLGLSVTRSLCQTVAPSLRLSISPSFHLSVFPSPPLVDSHTSLASTSVSCQVSSNTIELKVLQKWRHTA